MTTDTSEHGLENIIFNSMVGAGWIPSDSSEYDAEYCVDLPQLSTFLKDTQPDTAVSLALDIDSPTRRKFLLRLKNQVASQGIVKVLRDGIKHYPHNISLFYSTPTPGNDQGGCGPREESVLDNAPVALQQHQQEHVA